MTIPFWCVLAMIVLTYLAKVPVMKAMRDSGGYDNNHPRQQQEKLTGWGKRALAAHLNSFEALSVFAPCVLINHLTHADPFFSATLSLTFVVLRIAYIGLYIADYSTLRSLVWFASLTLSFWIGLLGTP